MDKLFTVEELAEYLNLAPVTIYRKLREGSIPAVRIGRRWRFPKELIDKWIAEHARNEKVSGDDPLQSVSFPSFPGRVIRPLSRRELYGGRR